MSVHGPISSDIAAQANVGVQGNNGSRRRKRQTTLVTINGHSAMSGSRPLYPLITDIRQCVSKWLAVRESSP
jgi:hypothetical protein